MHSTYVEEEYLLGSWEAEYHPAVGKMKLFLTLKYMHITD